MPSLRGTGGSTSGNNPASITLANSSVPQSGDIIRCFINQNPLASGVYGAITPPAGFSLDTDGSTSATVNKSDWAKLTCYKKTAGGSETNSYVFSFGSSMDGAAGNIVVTQTDTGTTRTVVTQDDTGSNTTFTIPSITTKDNNALVIAAICGGGNTAFTGITVFASAWTNSYTELRDICESNEWASCACATRAAASAGAVGTAQATSAVSDTSLAIVLEAQDSAGGGSVVRSLMMLGVGV